MQGTQQAKIQHDSSFKQKLFVCYACFLLCMERRVLELIYDVCRGYMTMDIHLTHLSVNQAHNSCLHPHSHCEASVHILVVKEGLETGQQEHECGVEIALPQRGIFISHETQKETEEGRRLMLNLEAQLVHFEIF